MTGRRERDWGGPGWWVFDAPILRDPLWWSALAGGIGFAVWQDWRSVDGFGTADGSMVVGYAVNATVGWLYAAVVLGSVRAYRRARASAA